MKYAISLSKEAIKKLERLDRKTEQRIQDALTNLPSILMNGDKHTFCLILII